MKIEMSDDELTWFIKGLCREIGLFATGGVLWEETVLADLQFKAKRLHELATQKRASLPVNISHTRAK